mgnify:CR=1 FL=1
MSLLSLITCFITKYKAIKTQIEIGNNTNGLVEVTTGLSEGSEIVKDGALTLKDGEIVTIKSIN